MIRQWLAKHIQSTAHHNASVDYLGDVTFGDVAVGAITKGAVDIGAVDKGVIDKGVVTTSDVAVFMVFTVRHGQYGHAHASSSHHQRDYCKRHTEDLQVSDAEAITCKQKSILPLNGV